MCQQGSRAGPLQAATVFCSRFAKDAGSLRTAGRCKMQTTDSVFGQGSTWLLSDKPENPEKPLQKISPLESGRARRRGQAYGGAKPPYAFGIVHSRHSPAGCSAVPNVIEIQHKKT
jgi:hypothetical protein